MEPIDLIWALPVMLRLRLTTFAAVLMTFLFDQAARRCALKEANLRVLNCWRRWGNLAAMRRLNHYAAKNVTG